MAEFIEREAAIQAVKHAWSKGLEPSQYIEIIPVADVVPVKHTSITRDQVEKMWRGEWIIRQDEYKEYIKKCSKCGFPISGWWGAGKFCPHCGAPMTDEAVQMVMEKLEVLYGNR